MLKRAELHAVEPLNGRREIEIPDATAQMLDEAELDRLAAGASASRLTNLTAIFLWGVRLKKLSTVSKFR